MSGAVKERVLNRPIVCVIFCLRGYDWLAICHQASTSNRVPPIVVKKFSGMAKELIYLIAIHWTAVGRPIDRLHAVAAIVVSAGKPLKTKFLEINGLTCGVQQLLGNQIA